MVACCRMMREHGESNTSPSNKYCNKYCLKYRNKADPFLLCCLTGTSTSS